jgi:hypothetical protein
MSFCYLCRRELELELVCNRGLDMRGGNLPEEIEWLEALAVLERAYPYFKEKRAIGFGRLIMMYQAGECKITRIQADGQQAPSFRVQVHGSGINITLPSRHP